VADGNVELHVVATDAAGNTTASAPLTKLVDNTKPNTTDDAPGGWHASPVTVQLSANDGGSGVNVTEYSVDGNPTYAVGTSVVIPAPADGSNDGAHTIAYFSVDNAGNIETVKSATVLIDATPPACPSCSAADYLRGTVTLSASPAADGSGIKSVSFEYSPAGASTWTTIGTDTTGPAPYTSDWDTTAVLDGHYDLRILITDNADNVTTADLPDKVVDNTNPNVATVGAPTEGQIVSGTVGISASASDATSPIASVELFVGGTSHGTDTTAPFTFSWDTTGGPDGAATIQIVVTDMAGNSTTSAVRNVTVDNVAPTPTLADPGQNLSGTVSLSASSDPDTTQVDFERRPAGGGSWVTIASDSSPAWGTSLDTTTLADGLYDFRAVATDGTGHTGASPIRANVRIDNTAPAGSLTAPTAGATVGGTNVTLSSSVSDGGSGVASVSYELRPTGSGAFTQIASSSTAPFSATWDATTVSTGSYDLRPIITDRAGNTFTGAAVTFNVDVTAPTVTLTSPGATIFGTVTLNATVSGSGATNVVFGATPTGGATWTSLGTDTSAPWSVSYDTTKLPDGVYDLRATVTDNLGNSSFDVVSGVRVDNAAPQVVSSSPADGSSVGSATAISLVTSEPATPLGVTLDGGATVTPVISGTHIDYNTGALAAGPHTLAGELQDPSGKRLAFRVHFTVGSSGYVEKNTSSSGSTTVTSADGFGAATMPSGAWSTTGNDWLVLRITPTAAPSGLTNGFGPGPEALDVTAYWALAGTQVHEFAQPIEVVIHSTDNGLVPATFESGAWRVIHRVPTPGVLPAGWTDGFWTAADGIHILTRHLSLFALLKDLEAPQAPQNVRGYLGPDGLTIRWLPGSDNSGTYDYVTLFAGSSDTGHFGPDYTATTVAGWTPGDPRIFRLQETDLAGNQSGLTPPLAQVPSLAGLTLDQAQGSARRARPQHRVGHGRRHRQGRDDHRAGGSRARAPGRGDRRDRRTRRRRDEPRLQGRDCAPLQAGEAEAVRGPRAAHPLGERHCAALQPAPCALVHVALQGACRQHDPAPAHPAPGAAARHLHAALERACRRRDGLAHDQVPHRRPQAAGAEDRDRPGGNGSEGGRRQPRQAEADVRLERRPGVRRSREPEPRRARDRRRRGRARRRDRARPPHRLPVDQDRRARRRPEDDGGRAQGRRNDRPAAVDAAGDAREDHSAARAQELAAEVDVLRLDRPGRATRCGLVVPVQIGVGDDLLRRRCAPRGKILGRVRVADERRVVPAHQRSVERGADAGVGLRADDDEPADAEVREHRLERRALERVAVALLDERLRFVRAELRDDPPLVGPCGRLSSACCTQTTGTSSWRAFSTRPATFATTVSRLTEPVVLPFCTSTTSSAVFGRLASVVKVSLLVSKGVRRRASLCWPSVPQ
jgi:hypothetical protein